MARSTTRSRQRPGGKLLPLASPRNSVFAFGGRPARRFQQGDLTRVTLDLLNSLKSSFEWPFTLFLGICKFGSFRLLLGRTEKENRRPVAVDLHESRVQRWTRLFNLLASRCSIHVIRRKQVSLGPALLKSGHVGTRKKCTLVKSGPRNPRFDCRFIKN